MKKSTKPRYKIVDVTIRLSDLVDLFENGPHFRVSDILSPVRGSPKTEKDDPVFTMTVGVVYDNNDSNVFVSNKLSRFSEIGKMMMKIGSGRWKKRVQNQLVMYQ